VISYLNARLEFRCICAYLATFFVILNGGIWRRYFRGNYMEVSANF